NSEVNEEEEAEPEDAFITTPDELRNMTSTWEKAATAFRHYVPPLTVQRSVQEVPDQSAEEVLDPYLDVRDKPAFGFPAGTRFICINVEPIHDLQYYVVMVRVDGRMKVVTAFPVLGD
ncbi:MAG: hypothetical protein QOF61_3236, partial [Acidobacteriota bacterium]|nr:hypothetical protein [Acidobacteriota bacterium]